MKRLRIIAIDPGKNGSISVRENRDILWCVKMPQTTKDIYDTIAEFVSNLDDIEIVCYLEKVSAMPGNGAVSMFSFGQGFGWLQMALVSLGIRTIEVRPNIWEKQLGLIDKKGTPKALHKNKLKARAQQLFPNIKVTGVNQDSLLISEYAYINEK